jgi:hypothetical protein
LLLLDLVPRENPHHFLGGQKIDACMSKVAANMLDVLVMFSPSFPMALGLCRSGQVNGWPAKDKLLLVTSCMSICGWRTAQAYALLPGVSKVEGFARSFMLFFRLFPIRLAFSLWFLPRRSFHLPRSSAFARLQGTKRSLYVCWKSSPVVDGRSECALHGGPSGALKC